MLQRLLAIDGAKLLFGGQELNGGQHTIPKKYGALQPTAVYVPLRKMLQVCVPADTAACVCTRTSFRRNTAASRSRRVCRTSTTRPLRRRCSARSRCVVAAVLLVTRWHCGTCARQQTINTATSAPAILQVVTEYGNKSVDKVIEACDRMHAHLTAAIVSKDEQFR